MPRRGRKNIAAGFRDDVKKNITPLLRGSVLAIDPGSVSMGFAWFDYGELVDSGEYKAGSKSSHRHKRLLTIAQGLATHLEPDILVVEKLFRYNPALIWSVGAAIVITKPTNMIEVPIAEWKALAAECPDYEKTDEQDAIIIGQTAINLAKEIQGE